MATLVSAILADARKQLNDDPASHWTDTELLSYLNAGQVEIATKVPNANAITATLALASGPKQSAPSDSLRIIEFVRNTNGNAVYPVDRKDMDAYLPNWANDTASSTIQHTMYNAEDDNTTFYVWPPAASASLEIVYAKTPAYLTATSQNIDLKDYYRNPLLDYVLYRAFGKDSDVTGDYAQRSQLHLKAFSDYLGIKYTFDANSSNKQQGGK